MTDARPTVHVLSHQLPPKDQDHPLAAVWPARSLPDLDDWLQAGGDPTELDRGRSLVAWAAAAGWGEGVVRLLSAGCTGAGRDASGASPLFLLFAAVVIENRRTPLSAQRWDDAALGVYALVQAARHSSDLRLDAPAYTKTSVVLSMSDFRPLLERLPVVQVLRLFEPRRSAAGHDPAPPRVADAWFSHPQTALWLWDLAPEATQRRWASSVSLKKHLAGWTDDSDIRAGCARLLAAGAHPGQTWTPAPTRPRRGGTPADLDGASAAQHASWLRAALMRCALGGSGALAEALLDAGALRQLPAELKGQTGSLAALLMPGCAPRLAQWGWQGPGAARVGPFVAEWLKDIGRWGRRGTADQALTLAHCASSWGIDPHHIPDERLEPRTLLHHVIEHARFQTRAEIDAWIRACPAAPMAAARGDLPLLHRAIVQGSAQWVDALLAAGLEADVRDNRGQTALMKALWTHPAKASVHDLLKMAQCLIDAGASVAAVDEGGNSVFHLPIELQTRYRYMLTAEQARVEFLVDAGAGDLLNTLNAAGNPPLHAALENGMTLNGSAWMKALLKAGADPAVCNSGGETLLHRIARHGDAVDLIQVLGTAALADERLNAPDAQGCRPLHHWVAHHPDLPTPEDRALLTQWIPTFPWVGPVNPATEAVADRMTSWAEAFPEHAGLQQFRWLWALARAPATNPSRPRM